MHAEDAAAINFAKRVGGATVKGIKRVPKAISGRMEVPFNAAAGAFETSAGVIRGAQRLADKAPRGTKSIAKALALPAIPVAVIAGGVRALNETFDGLVHNRTTDEQMAHFKQVAAARREKRMAQKLVKSKYSPI